MSDVGPTEPLPRSSAARSTGTGDELRVERTDYPREGTATGARPVRHDGDDERSSADEALAKAQRPENRAKLLLATTALTLLNLILLLVILTNVLGDSYETVTVDGTPCVVETGGDESILYCQR